MTQSSPTTDDHIARVLGAMAGPNAVPREDQTTAIRALVDDRARVLVVQATGWGKSAVYWAATAALRAGGAGPTLVISPLLALMRDQVSAAEGAGLTAATINSTNNDDWDAVFARLDAGALDVLLISPERLAAPGFQRRLAALADGIGMLVIDEAHCISDWGFDFRPDYQRIARTLLHTEVPVLATTATANARVTADVARQLGDSTLTLRGSLARNTLRLGVTGRMNAAERYAWLDIALHDVAGSGIVYCLTIADVERLCEYLTDRGHHVAAYTGGHDAEHRRDVEDRLRANEVKAVIATSALGMGYDKPDLAFVVHVGSPSSPVAYYQQVGRAGRAIDDAVAVLMPTEADEALWEYFATSGVPDPRHAATLLDVLRLDEPLSVPAIESSTGLRRGRIDSLLRVLHVDGAVDRRDGGWVATGQPWQFDHAKYGQLRRAREHEAELMRRYAAGDGCLDMFLREALDDPDTGQCGRCSVCTGRPVTTTGDPDADSVAAARTWLRGRDTVLEPRKLWPSGISGRRGRIVGATDGRAIAYGDDPAFDDVIAALRSERPDDAAIDVLTDAALGVLGRWRHRWAARPTAIAFIPTRRPGDLPRRLAERIAAAGKLPMIDAFDVTGEAAPYNVASARRVGALLTSLRLRAGVRFDGPLLLVDDTYQTGWTMTVAAALAREAGAESVLPLVVRQQP